MNLGDFRTRIGGAVNLKTGAAGTERDLVDAWVNEGIVDFLRRTKLVYKTSKMAATVNVGDYELDSAILAMKELYYEPSGNLSVLLRPVDGTDIRQWRLSNAIVAANSPWCYALEGSNLLMLYPTPQSSSDFLHLLYVPRPTALSGSTDDPSITANGQIPKEFHQVIEAYAKWKAADYVDDASSQMGQLYLQEYMVGVADAIGSTTKKAGVRLAGTTWGKRGVHIPVMPYVDDGS